MVILGIFGQANIALTRWVEEGSIFILIRVARLKPNSLKSCEHENSRRKLNKKWKSNALV